MGSNPTLSARLTDSILYSTIFAVAAKYGLKERGSNLNIIRLDNDALGLIVASAKNAMEEALRIFDGYREWKNRQGGYFSIADAETGLFHIVTPIGMVSSEKTLKYLFLCQEKARRLSLNPCHVSSWQSRDEAKHQLGGAIRCGSLTFSLSGLPELGNEAVMLKSAQRCMPALDGLILRPIDVNVHLDAIADISGNPFWSNMRDGE